MSGKPGLAPERAEVVSNVGTCIPRRTIGRGLYGKVVEADWIETGEVCCFRGLLARAGLCFSPSSIVRVLIGTDRCVEIIEEDQTWCARRAIGGTRSPRPNPF